MDAKMVGIAGMLVGSFGIGGAIANMAGEFGIEKNAFLIAGAIIFSSGLVALALGLRGE